MHFSYDFPYPSRRMPLLARNAVATSQPLASQAGVEMLRRGGNAVDAAVAAAATLAVVEPTRNGLGSDAFAIVWDGGALHGLNASGRAPRAWGSHRFSESIPTRGWESVTVPGAVSGWTALHQRFGQLPFSDLLAPAIRYASEGFHVTPFVARSWAAETQDLRSFPDFAQAFLPSGRPPDPGDLFRVPAIARTLAALAESQGRAFYEGSVAESIARAARVAGAALTEEDLETHMPEWSDTRHVRFAGADIHEMPPPTQGVAVLIALELLRRHDVSRLGLDSVESLHLQIEAVRVAMGETHRHVADPERMRTSVDDLLDETFLDALATRIDPRRASVVENSVPRAAGTVYLAAGDEAGVMVSLIQSNYMGFGSGIVVPDTGIALQNRAVGFTLESGHPNEATGGFRPFHTIIPAFALRDGRALMSFGVMGGPMQPQGHVQMAVRTLVHGQNPQAAVDAPRWRIGEGTQVHLEPGYPDAVVRALKAKGHQVQVAQVDDTFAFGGAQILWRTEHGYIAASDPRKDGQATGF